MISDTDDEDGPDRSRLRWLLSAAGVMAAVCVVVWWPGCRQYPAVSSPESLTLMKLLYTACNTRDPARLDRVEQGVEKFAREGRMSPGEQTAFRRIIALARGGDWPQAQAASLRFAQDQVGMGSSASASRDTLNHRGAK